MHRNLKFEIIWNLKSENFRDFHLNIAISSCLLGGVSETPPGDFIIIGCHFINNSLKSEIWNLKSEMLVASSGRVAPVASSGRVHSAGRLSSGRVAPVASRCFMVSVRDGYGFPLTHHVHVVYMVKEPPTGCSLLWLGFGMVMVSSSPTKDLWFMVKGPPTGRSVFYG